MCTGEGPSYFGAARINFCSGRVYFYEFLLLFEPRGAHLGLPAPCLKPFDFDRGTGPVYFWVGRVYFCRFVLCLSLVQPSWIFLHHAQSFLTLTRALVWAACGRVGSTFDRVGRSVCLLSCDPPGPCRGLTWNLVTLTGAGVLRTLGRVGFTFVRTIRRRFESNRC